MKNYDVIIIGAGAAGLMCAIEAGKRGRKVCVLDHAKKPAEKIRISGGGRCNFTNIYTAPSNFISRNKHFCKSALKRYTQHDFIDMVAKHGIDYHEKTLGQQFCDDSAQQIIQMLLDECHNVGVEIVLECQIKDVQDSFQLVTSVGHYKCESLVIATGGPSIPKMGSSDFAYRFAKTHGLKMITPEAALVPFTFDEEMLASTKTLSGISVDAVVSCNNTSFREGLLFTHRGISGPSILQISSYWNQGDSVCINLAPDTDVEEMLKDARTSHPKQNIETVISSILPKRLAQSVCEWADIHGKIADLSDKKIKKLSSQINRWTIAPSGTEGYRTAEVTRGGVDTDDVSSKTFESKNVTGLYFIGECLDVTGHLGGFNFQWAWSSGWCAGQYV